MKKTLTLALTGFCVVNSFAQDLTSKKGEQMLPEAKDWSIGIDATPFLEYMGNFFGKTGPNSAPTFNFLNSNQTITGKYFTDAQTAYRASLRLGFTSQAQRNMVADRSYVAPTPNSFPSADPRVENEYKRSGTNIGLAVGIEKRRGKTRLQGYYGGEVGINFSTSKDKFTYGNALNPTGTPVVGVSADDSFTNNVVPVSTLNITGANGDARITERKNGSVFSFGVRGFIGAEYFILPKISLGGEFGWGIGLRTGGKTSTTYEMIGNTGAGADQVGSTTIEGAKQGRFGIDTDNVNSIFGPSGSIRLNFHF